MIAHVIACDSEAIFAFVSDDTNIEKFTVLGECLMKFISGAASCGSHANLGLALIRRLSESDRILLHDSGNAIAGSAAKMLQQKGFRYEKACYTRSSVEWACVNPHELKNPLRALALLSTAEILPKGDKILFCFDRRIHVDFMQNRTHLGEFDAKIITEALDKFSQKNNRHISRSTSMSFSNCLHKNEALDIEILVSGYVKAWLEFAISHYDIKPEAEVISYGDDPSGLHLLSAVIDHHDFELPYKVLPIIAG